MPPEDSVLEWLPEIKFSELKRNNILRATEGSADKLSIPLTGGQLYLRTGEPQPEAYERVSSDKLGGELKSGGSIWQLYQAEAREYDRELVNPRHKRLDMMLLFAGLFSSVLTGFVVESAKLLQQDPADAALDVLLLMAQSQQRIESGNPQLQSSMVTRPEFNIPLSARWINGLWFLSLIISLTGALSAMLAREWLLAFMNSQPRSPHAYALLHQARLKGMHQWHALHIIDLLPTILQCALFLFAIGLVIYLWTLDYVVAILVAIVSGVTFICYVATTFFVAVSDFCPFVTHASRYIQSMRIPDWIAYAEKMSDDAEKLPGTTIGELRALKWLAENARDPAIGECTHQALAGLRMGETSTGSNKTESKTDTSSAGKSEEPHKTDSDSDPDSEAMVDFLNRMLDDVCLKLPQLLAGRSKLSASGGLSLSKYANALPHLVQFLAQSSIYTHSRPAEPRLSPPRQQLGDRVLGLGSWWRSRRPAAKEPSGYNSGTGGSREGIEGQMPDKDSVGSKPIQLALKSLECTWEKDVPYLTADTHALLTIAELRLIENAARVCDSEAHSSCSESPHQLVPNAPHIQQNGNGSIRVLCHYRDTSDNTVVDIPMNGGKGNLKQKLEGPDLLELRARYSRVLFRAGVQLSNHSTNRIQIDPSVLKDLLKCIREAFSCARLNPEGEGCISTHHPKPTSVKLPTFCAMLIGSNACIMLGPRSIAEEYGLLYGLLRIVGQRRMRDSPDLTMAARHAFRSIVPILLRQWFDIVKSHIPEGSEESQAVGPAEKRLALIESGGPWAEGPKLDEIGAHVDHREIRVMRQLIITALIGVTWIKLGDPNIGRLATLALQALRDMTKGAYGQFHVQTTFQHSEGLFKDLIETAATNLKLLQNDTVDCLRDLLHPKFYKHPIPQSLDDKSSLLCEHSLCHIRILKISTWVPGEVGKLQKFIQKVEDDEIEAHRENETFGQLPTFVGNLDDLLTETPEKQRNKPYVADFFVAAIISTFHPRRNGDHKQSYWSRWLDNTASDRFSDLLKATKFALGVLSAEDPRCPEFASAIISAVETYPRRSTAAHPQLAPLLRALGNIISASNIVPFPDKNKIERLCIQSGDNPSI